MFRNSFSAVAVSAIFASASVSATEKPLVMTRFTVTDVERNKKQPLGTILIPQGWKADSKIEWTLTSAMFPFSYWAKYASPDGSAFVEVFPVVQGSSSSSPFGNQGSMGPKDVIDGLAKIAQSVRPNSRLKIVASQTADAKKEIQRPAYDAVSSTLHQTATLTVIYKDGEDEIVEEFAGSFYLMQTDMAAGYSSRVWAMHGLRSIRAPKDRFPETRSIGTAMLRTAKPTPEFLKAVEIASQCVVNIVKHDRQLRTLEQDLWLRTQREVNDAWRKTTEERWASQDRQNEQLRDLLGNVNRFLGRDGEVLLPTTHKHAWEGPNGTFLLTDDPSYRPTDDFTGEWDRLKAKR
jgi:hypothetical protein